MAKCTKCKKDVDEKAKFCPNCGTSTTPEAKKGPRKRIRLENDVHPVTTPAGQHFLIHFQVIADDTLGISSKLVLVLNETETELKTDRDGFGSWTTPVLAKSTTLSVRVRNSDLNVKEVELKVKGPEKVKVMPAKGTPWKNFKKALQDNKR